MPRKRRLGIVDRTTAGWTAGRSYTEALIRSLLLARAEEKFEIVRLTSSSADADALDSIPIAVHRVPASPREQVDRWLEARVGRPTAHALRPAAAIAGRVATTLRRSPLLDSARAIGVDALLPLTELPARTPIATVAWIPDFQHALLPQFFSAEELALRDAGFRELADGCSRVMLSSDAVRADFARFAPLHASKARVARFPSGFVFRPPPAASTRSFEAFDVPPRFVLVVNQIWRHKNHALVVDAVAKARDLGVEPTVVIVGLPADYRDPENETVSRLLQQVAALRLTRQVRILGKVSYAVLVDLLRAAAVVVQPSLCEGWSTTVEDAKALGRPLLCSDLAVHREQAPDALGFFGCDDAAALAQLLAKHWPTLEAGGDPSREAIGLAQARESALAFGRAVQGICEEIT